MKNKAIHNSIVSIIFVTILSQVIALLREAIFAYFYGTSGDSDAYVLATQIPVTIFAIISTAINTVILPLYLQKKETSGERESGSFIKSFIIAFSVVAFIIVFLEEIFALPIIKVFAPGFSTSALRTTVLYCRILFPTVIMTGITNIFTAVLNAEGKFVYPTIAALSQNIVLIMVMGLFGKKLGIIAAVWGTFAGIACNLLLIVFSKIHIFFLKADYNAFKNDIGAVLYRVLPIALGVGIAEINRVVDRAVASGLDSGSITALNYSNKLTTVLSSLILSAVTTVSFKEFSQDYIEGKFTQRNNSLNSYLSLLSLFLIPITCGVMLLRKEVIVIAFARGAFETDAVSTTADIFMYYALGITFIAIREILSKFFYSSGDTKTPLLNSAVGVMLNIVLNLCLAKVMGAGGLALATTISGVVVCVLLFMSAYKKYREFNIKDFAKNLSTIICGALIMLISLTLFNQKIMIENVYAKFFSNFAIGVLIYFSVLLIVNKQLIFDSIKLLFKTRT